MKAASPEIQKPSGLDQIDLGILDALQGDASRSTAALAEKAALSMSPCWRRINRQKEEGSIRREKLGFNTLVFASVSFAAYGRAIAETIRRFAEVVGWHVVMGSIDFMLKIGTPTSTPEPGPAVRRAEGCLT
jgi:Lrp/AsnC family transcriptional regulator